jgi:hypothetical protein
VGQFAFAGARAPGPLEAGLDPEPDLTTCSFDPGFPSSVAFSAILARDPAGTGAALCGGSVYFGSRDGTFWSVQGASSGAVLAACSPTCVARSQTTVRGDLLSETAAAEFRGGLVETLSPSAGDCAGCVLPCAGRYELTGTRETP